MNWILTTVVLCAFAAADALLFTLNVLLLRAERRKAAPALPEATQAAQRETAEPPRAADSALCTLLRNIDAYDGTASGQREVKRG